MQYPLTEVSKEIFPELEPKGTRVVIDAVRISRNGTYLKSFLG
jgi:hypothetical protein